MNQIKGKQNNKDKPLSGLLSKDTKNMRTYTSYIGRSILDAFDHSFNYPVEDKTLPIDSFILLITRDPLTYHDYTLVDQELARIKEKPGFLSDSFSLEDLSLLLKAEEKDWENEAEQFKNIHPSWKIRKALAERALEYFNADQRAEVADIVMRREDEKIECEIVNKMTENSFRLYRNGIDVYNDHIHAYDYAIENTKGVNIVIELYLNQVQKSKEDADYDLEEFEWNQEVILIKIADYVEHWQEVKHRAQEKEMQTEKINAEENILLFKSLIERLSRQTAPVRTPWKKKKHKKRKSPKA